MIWSVEQIEVVRKMASDGKRVIEIATFFGKTRNSIIGLCDRNRILFKVYEKRERKPLKKDTRKRVRKRIVSINKKPDYKFTSMPFADIKQGQCAYIIGPVGKKTMCCGQDVAVGSYCEHHAIKCYKSNV